MKALKTSIRAAVADDCGVPHGNVDVALAPGSVSVVATVTSPDGVNIDTLKELLEHSTSLSQAVVNAVNLIPSLGGSASGAIKVSPSIVVAVMDKDELDSPDKEVADEIEREQQKANDTAADQKLLRDVLNTGEVEDKKEPVPDTIPKGNKSRDDKQPDEQEESHTDEVRKQAKDLNDEDIAEAAETAKEEGKDPAAAAENEAKEIGKSAEDFAKQIIAQNKKHKFGTSGIQDEEDANKDPIEELQKASAKAREMKQQKASACAPAAAPAPVASPAAPPAGPPAPVSAPASAQPPAPAAPAPASASLEEKEIAREEKMEERTIKEQEELEEMARKTKKGGKQKGDDQSQD